MLPENNIAFKEWAAVCRALATGRQSIILRKGGIHEGRAGFRVEHDEFWLFPTRFHEARESLSSEAAHLIDEAAAQQPAPGAFALRHYAVVDCVVELTDERQLDRLRGHHVLAEEVVRQRFHYRRAGLFVLIVRVFAMPQPHVLAETPEIAGCKSWVRLDVAVSTAGALSVQNDQAFDERRGAIVRALSVP
jgi:hypothetical protein